MIWASHQPAWYFGWCRAIRSSPFGSSIHFATLYSGCDLWSHFYYPSCEM